MIFYLSILGQPQKQEPDSEIPKSPQPLQQGLQTRYHQAKVKEIQQTTRANYFLERCLFS